MESKKAPTKVEKQEVKEREHAQKEEAEKEVLRSDVLKKEEAQAAKKQEKKIEPLQPGQKYFEAPDGTILVGEADKQQLWYRKLNDGRGGWVNPKR